jgi:two-component system sensor histidine kinase KdpD
LATGSPSWTERTGGAGAAARAALPWLLLVAAATAGLWAWRDHLDKAHAALVYLLVVLGASSRRGRAAGLTVAVASFLCFNFFLLPPYYTFIIHDPLDLLVLFVFLVTGAVAAQQLYRAQREAAVARQRAAEVERFSTLGAETLNAGRADEAIQAVARVIQGTLGIGACEVFLRDGEGGAFRRIAGAMRPGYDAAGDARTDELLTFVLERGTFALQRTGGATHVSPRSGETFASAFLAHRDARVLLLPLQVRGRGVGILRLADSGAIRLDAPQRRFAEALAYYAALGLERVRLAAEAEHAEALREADRLKDALIASVSHDLRTPLTTIKALAHDIRVDGDERAAAVEEEADRLNRFVSDLLDLSRLNSGTVRVEPELNAAEDLLGAALQRTSGALGGHELRTSLPPGELLLGRFDLVHALRALVNLVENACKYSPPGAPVDLAVEREGDLLAFRVADRGPGVPEAELARIYEPFYRVGDVPDAGGTGLGLTIARRLAEAQGGAIRYEDREGGGSVFTLLLPAAEFPSTDGPALPS